MTMQAERIRAGTCLTAFPVPACMLLAPKGQVYRRESHETHIDALVQHMALKCVAVFSMVDGLAKAFLTVTMNAWSSAGSPANSGARPGT
jgi:hypothetical protein